MNAALLQENLENLSQNISNKDFVFNLLSAYEIPKSTIKLLRNALSKDSGNENEILLKNKLLFHLISAEEDEHVVIDSLLKGINTNKYKPRFIVVTDYKTFLAVDTKTNETLDININDLGKHYAFFLPWMGMEKAQHINENPADIRAAYKMDKLYQAIVNDNNEYYEKYSHDLNVFLSRLLFCFFSEDTGIFSKGLFTKSIISLTSENGEDLKSYFSTLFDVLNTKDNDRLEYAEHYKAFPYVNGGLFDKKIELPNFNRASRKLILECGKLGWDSINPDIFGSMIQAVVHPGQRENLGMHYTSVPNIMKVIEPLFLNDLYEELEKSNIDCKKLTKLRERVSKIMIFDPACGSGNFLIISYKELCNLEIEILKNLSRQDSFASLEGWNYSQSAVSLNNFFGIEIDDFAHEIAKLSLYLAQHQVNLKFEKEFGKLKPILPLKESGKIVCGNATRVDWNEVCPRTDKVTGEHEIYVVGNPPYLGSRNQEGEQKEDLKNLFIINYKSLDYISAWFYKGAKYILGYRNIKLAFVSTNSISQGEQVSLLWPRILNEGVEIFFAHQSFKWKNLAKGNAGVTCVIIGLSNLSTHKKYLYNENQYSVVKEINPYLKNTAVMNVIKRSSPISYLPEMTYGNMPLEGNFLKLDLIEKADLINKYPNSAKFIRPLIGGSEFMNGNSRFCLWIEDADLSEVNRIIDIKKRIDNVRKFRETGGDVARTLAERSHQFRYRHEAKNHFIIVPCTSSENRDYMPCGVFDSKFISLNSLQVIYDSDLYVFGILVSKMHMTWVRAVGGRLKTDLRYSSALCYNTFPFPDITPKQKESLASHVYNILEEREKYPEKTMADLYDPDMMPDGLQEAHKYLDIAIDQIYRSKPFDSDEDRLAHLFKLYEEMITRKTNR